MTSVTVTPIVKQIQFGRDARISTPAGVVSGCGVTINAVGNEVDMRKLSTAFSRNEKDLSSLIAIIESADEVSGTLEKLVDEFEKTTKALELARAENQRLLAEIEKLQDEVEIEVPDVNAAPATEEGAWS